MGTESHMDFCSQLRGTWERSVFWDLAMVQMMVFSRVKVLTHTRVCVHNLNISQHHSVQPQLADHLILNSIESGDTFPAAELQRTFPEP